jgi:hypothetical protein
MNPRRPVPENDTRAATLVAEQAQIAELATNR